MSSGVGTVYIWFASLPSFGDVLHCSEANWRASLQYDQPTSVVQIIIGTVVAAATATSSVATVRGTTIVVAVGGWTVRASLGIELAYSL